MPWRGALSVGLAGLLCMATALADDPVIDRVFEGAWFSVAVPEGFTVEEVRPSGSADGAEAIRLHAPDSTAAIFLHAPQWAAPAPETEAEAGEALVSERARTRGSVTTTWRIFEQAGTGRRRALRILEDALGPTLTVTGIEYDDRQALARWRPAHAAAVRSLQQFSD